MACEDDTRRGPICGLGEERIHTYIRTLTQFQRTLLSAQQMTSALLSTDFPDLTLLSRGKVRDIYTTSSENCLLFVATDRISVYDVILKEVRDRLPATL